MRSVAIPYSHGRALSHSRSYRSRRWKRGEECLRHHVVSRADSEAAAIALDPRGVAAEEHGEVLRLIMRPPDDGRVVLGVTPGGAGWQIRPLTLLSHIRWTFRVSSDTRCCRERAFRFPTCDQQSSCLMAPASPVAVATPVPLVAESRTP